MTFGKQSVPDLDVFLIKLGGSAGRSALADPDDLLNKLKALRLLLPVPDSATFPSGVDRLHSFRLCEEKTSSKSVPWQLLIH